MIVAAAVYMLGVMKLFNGHLPVFQVPSIYVHEILLSLEGMANLTCIYTSILESSRDMNNIYVRQTSHPV